MRRSDFPTHPYERIQRYVTLRGAEQIPRQICQYLLDLPLPGYEPPDSNDYPRARLMKYLYHDGVDPLAGPLPTPEQKLAMVFDPLRQTDPPDKDKCYRVFLQSYVSQTEYVGKTILRAYMGQTVARSVHHCELSVIFECMTNVVYEGAAGTALSRTWAMECALLEALNGININGVGTLYFDRAQHHACGSYPIDDRGTNVGRRLVLGLTWGGRLMEWEKLFSACPEAWNDLLVYPVLMRDYSLFLAVKDSILSAQQSWPFPWSTAKYWDGLFGMGLIPRLCLMLKLVFRLEERDGALPLFPKMNGEKLESLTVFQGEQTGVITAKNFGGLRELIARQNGLELPDETNNAELVEAKRYLAQQGTPPLKADFESLIYSVACALKTDPEELLNWTIRRFRATEQALDRSIGHLTASITLAAGGKFKGGNPYPSWKYDREETGGFETLDALSKRVDGTIEAR